MVASVEKVRLTKLSSTTFTEHQSYAVWRDGSSFREYCTRPRNTHDEVHVQYIPSTQVHSRGQQNMGMVFCMAKHDGGAPRRSEV